MINMRTEEYREGDLAVRTIVITFLCIPIFKFKKTSTNNVAVGQLTPIKKKAKIKGFIRYETEN